MMARAKVTVIALAVSAALSVSALVLVPYLITAQNEKSDDGARRIVVFDKYAGGNSDPHFMHVKVPDGLQTNSQEWFLDPYGRSMEAFYRQNINSTSAATAEERRQFLERADAYEHYLLIRLPGWLGAMGCVGSEECVELVVRSSDDIAGKYVAAKLAVQVEGRESFGRALVWDSVAADNAGGDRSMEMLAIVQGMGLEMEELIYLAKKVVAAAG